MNILFIGGTGRSGTTITRDILARHPDVASLPFEYRFLIDPGGIVEFYATYPHIWSPYIADKRIKELEKFLFDLTRPPLHHKVISSVVRSFDPSGHILTPKRYHRYELDKYIPSLKNMIRDLISELKEFSYRGTWVGSKSYSWRNDIYFSFPMSQRTLRPILRRFVNRVLDSLLNSLEGGQEVFVEDNTWNILFAVELLELIPEAKILHVYRDPRDVVASFTRQRWTPSDPKQAACFYRALMAKWLEIKEKLPDNSFSEIKLEDIVRNPDKSVSSICEFIGIDFHSMMLEPVNLSKANLGRWEIDFTDWQDKETVLDIVSEYVDILGYLR